MRKQLYYKGIFYNENLCEIAKISSLTNNSFTNCSLFSQCLNCIYRFLQRFFPSILTYVILESNTIPSIHFECQKHIDDMQEIIALANQKAKEQGIINGGIYDIALCINKHFYDENLQEIRAYFIDEKNVFNSLKCVDTHKVIIGIDSFILAKEIESGFLYISDYEEIVFIQNQEICSTLHAHNQDLEQKITILRDMYGDFDLHSICLRDEVAILLEVALRQAREMSIWDAYKHNIISEWENHKNALLHNKTLFLPSSLGFFTCGKTHILRNSLIALCFVVCFIYPSILFVQNALLHSNLSALQDRDFDFDDLQSKATTQENEIKELQEKNANLFKKLDYLAKNLNTPPSVHISEIFDLLKTFDITLEHIVFARSEEMSVMNLRIYAFNQAQIMRFLKALNTQKSEAKVKQILHKDDKSYSEVFIVRYE